MNLKTRANHDADIAIASYDHSCLHQQPPHMQLLSNGRLVTAFATTGTGCINYDSLAVTRWKPDFTCDCLCYAFYLRDLDAGKFFSLAYHPTCRDPQDYQVRYSPGQVLLERSDDGLMSRLEVCIHGQLDTDLRRISITNNSDVARAIEITSYTELVLQHADADLAHPAFSKLFVQTEWVDDRFLFAHRRARRDGEKTLSACHFMVNGSSEIEPIQFETDRNRFLGRGRSLAKPHAMSSDSRLSGTVGSILDPIFSLRTVLIIPPGGTETVTYALGAGYSRDQLIEMAQQLDDAEVVDAAFQAADEHACQRLEKLGITPDVLPQMLRAATLRLYGLESHTRDDSHKSQNGVSPATNITDEALDKLGIANSPFARKTAIREGARSFFRASKQDHQESKLFNEQRDDDEKLLAWNSFGGFTTDGREYVLRLSSDADGHLRLPPVPWNNIVSSETTGFIASETGSGYTWNANSRLNRLSPWQNDPVLDPHSEAIYLRNSLSGEFWSLTPGPVPRQTTYEVRHGWGYTLYKSSFDQLSQELTQFVPLNDPVKISRIRLTNHGKVEKHLTLYSYVQWQLSEGQRFSSLAIQTSLDESHQAVYAVNHNRGPFSKSVAFVSMTGDGICHLTADRTEFLGLHGDTQSPRSVVTGDNLRGRAGNDLDPCGAAQLDFVIPPGETFECAWLLGETSSEAEAASVIAKYQSASTIDEAFDDVRSMWVELLSSIRVETPSPAIDLMLNGWLAYQNISCRVWGRSSSYQCGGAYGFRDQLQDASALVHHRPDITRNQILRNAAHQFVEGDVLHWWHPPESRGLRTEFSDDLLWLPLVASEYIAATGDDGLWNEQVRFLTAEPLPPGESELYLLPNDSGQMGSVYEHCCRALDRGLTRGRNGLPLMGCGDWNDGMNRVGIFGSGESVWLGFFIDYILERMLPVCEMRGDTARFQKYSEYRAPLREALNDAGWDGKWYRRAYFDDGTPLGTTAADECRIDALVQAWAVLSRAAPPERAASAMAAAEKYLVDEKAGIIRLLDPPFDKMGHDPGYIKGYLPGVRENGGQYTHGVLWLVRAFAELGRGSRACQLLEMLSPVRHGDSPEAAAVYKAEPYVVAADVYGQPPHVGRAGWSWYTGSAGWMFRVGFESILGIHLEGGSTLRIDPCISSDWPVFKIQYRLADRVTVYEIVVRNPQGKEHGVSTATVDGKQVMVDSSGAHVPLTQDGRHHRVEIVL